MGRRPIEKKAATDAERQQKRRERLIASGGRRTSLTLSAEAADALDALLEQDRCASSVMIEILILLEHRRRAKRSPDVSQASKDA